MPTYIGLLKWTDQGARNVKEALARNEQGRAAIERAGGRVIGAWWTMGAYDTVVVAEYPDDETASAVALAVGMAGNIHSETLRAYGVEEMQRAQLAVLEAAGVALVQQGKQRRGLQGRVVFKLGHHPGPDLGKRVRTRAVGSGLLELAGQLAAPLIGARGAHAHPGTGRGLGLHSAFGAFSQHAEDLPVALHGGLLRLERHVQAAPRCRASKRQL